MGSLSFDAARAVIQKFDPDQPRGEDGKWTDAQHKAAGAWHAAQAVAAGAKGDKELAIRHSNAASAHLNARMMAARGSPEAAKMGAKARLMSGALGFEKFDPSEPRDEEGKWTDGGGGPSARETRGAAFASPNLATSKDLPTSIRDLGGSRQRAFEHAGNEIDNALGISGRHQVGAVGAWSDGAENSTMTEMDASNPDAVRVSAAMRGALAQQKAVLAFTPDRKGGSALYDMTVSGSPADLHQALLKSGVPFHTLIPTGNATRIVVVDTDGSLGTKVGDFAVAHKTQAERTLGHAEFIGDQDGTGSDAEQRKRGLEAYERVIASSTSRYQGRSAGEVWQGVRDRWSTRLAAIKNALGFGQALDVIKGFDPNEPRDDQGQWTDGGGGGSSASRRDAQQIAESLDDDAAWERGANAHIFVSAGVHGTGPAEAKDIKAQWIRSSPLKTIDAVYAGSDENKRSLDGVCEKIAAETGAEYRAPGIKKLPRVLEKESLEKMAAGRRPAGVTDIVRSTFAVSDPAQADRVVRELGAHFPTTDEGYKITAAGYFDRAVNVRFRNGQIGEVLIAPPELIEAKSDSGGGGHTLYKKWRSLPDDSPEKEPLRRAQIDLYGAARAKLSTHWNAVLGNAFNASPA